MADNDSQPGTSVGSSKNINNTVSGNEIGRSTQNIKGGIHQQAEKIINICAELMKHVTFNVNNSTANTSTANIDYCPAPVPTFLGRYKELWTLKTLFAQHQMVALVGMEGLGKTQLSRKYVQVNKADYQYKYWLESETPEKLENSFKMLANKLDIKSVNIKKVVNDVYKKIQAVRTILVFDNVEKPTDIYAYLPTRVNLPPGVTIHVLVTSRWVDWTWDEQIECYKLQPLDISESLQILQRKFYETDRKELQDKWEELAEMLGYLPLALHVAESNIYKQYKHNPDLCTVLTDYMKQLKDGTGRLLNDKTKDHLACQPKNTSIENIQSKSIDTEEIIPKNLREPAQQKSNQNAEEAEACGSKDINNLTSYEPKPERRNPINNIAPAVHTFIGREMELNDINQRFHHYPVVVIAAMGGMGKTQLARKFASVNADVYRDRYWINAESEEHLLKSFDRLAKKVEVEANTDIDTVHNTYRSFTEGAALLIFDNVENEYNVYKYLPTRIQLEDITLHVLVTSRWTEWTSDSSVNCYQLQPLDISVSLQLFRRKFGQTCIETMQDKWEELARMLGYLPLALQVATSYIYKRYKHNPDLPMILADYMKQLEEGADGLLNDPLTEYGNRSVYASMMLTLKQLENKANNVSNVQTDDKWKFAIIIINAAAYMNPDFIEKKSLLKLVDNHENICKLDDALTILTEYSLFNQRVDWGGDTIYSVHRIIQSSIRHSQTLMETADMYYIRVLKYTFAEDYFPWDVLQYANERASAVAVYFKDNPSLTILEYLVKNKAIAAMEAVLKLISASQIQIAMKEHDLLYRAVENGDINMIQLLCKYGADINQLCRYDGRPLLHQAMRWRNLEIFKWLLENGAASTVRDRVGRNALHVAIMEGNHKMVSTIIQTDRAVVNETDNDGRTPLHAINYYHNEEDIFATTRVLVESGADITAVDKHGNTVLHSVTRSACAAAVSLILQLNKDLVDIQNEFGETALHVIPYNNTVIDDERILSTIRVLIKSGVDLTKVDKWGNTVLHSAARGARAAAVTLILKLNKDLINIKNNHGDTALLVIPYDYTVIDDERILSTILVLVESGVDLTRVDKWGNTVLHSATQGARAAAVSLILQLNKDLINIENKDGETALHVIPYNSRRIDERILSTIRVLVESGVDLTKVDIRGNTVLHSVTRSACAAAVSLILQLNKDLINIQNEFGETALHVIPYYDTDIDDERILSTISVLVESGVDLTEVDIRGNTVLHSITRSACVAAVSLILQLNKDLVDIKNKVGQTALHVIPYYDTGMGDERILSTIRVFLKSGVDLTKVDIRGNTVLHSVTRSACAAAVSLILQLHKDLINIENKDGQTALHVIPYYDTDIDDERILSTIRVLVDSGVDLTKVDIRGNTVLHSAAKGARAAAVSLILQLNKDLMKIVNNNGQTALHILGNQIDKCDEDDFEALKETARVLIMNGLSLDTKDKTECTPLDTVRDAGLKYLLRQVADECNNHLLVLPVERQGFE